MEYSYYLRNLHILLNVSISDIRLSPVSVVLPRCWFRKETAHINTLEYTYSLLTETECSSYNTNQENSIYDNISFKLDPGA